MVETKHRMEPTEVENSMLLVEGKSPTQYIKKCFLNYGRNYK